MLNTLWVFLVLAAVVAGALGARLEEVSRASVESAQAAVTIAIGLWGITALWLGLMRVLHAAGAMQLLSRLLRPLMKRLFPEVPEEHPAMGAMIMNMACNILGLGNVATPFGLKAMQELSKLGGGGRTATNAMALFLAINTSGLAVLPTGMVALRASLGSKQPGAIFAPTLIATMFAAICGIVSAKILAPWFPYRGGPQLSPTGETESIAEPEAPGMPDNSAFETQAHKDTRSVTSRWTARLGVLVVLASFGVALWLEQQRLATGIAQTLHTLVSQYFLAFLMSLILCAGVWRGVKIYDCVVDGAREAFAVITRIVPYLVVILVAVGMLRASGAVDMLTLWAAPLTAYIGMPADALPMALIRPLSGQGAYGVAADIMRSAGPDSLTGNIVSTLMGSTETTFYVLALYLGAAGIKESRHAVWACLFADLGGILMSVWACRLLIGAS